MGLDNYQPDFEVCDAMAPIWHIGTIVLAIPQDRAVDPKPQTDTSAPAAKRAGTIQIVAVYLLPPMTSIKGRSLLAGIWGI